MMSFRKSFSDTSAPSPARTCQTLPAQSSNSVRPGDFRLLLGSPPSRCLTTSVVRLRVLHLLTPATYFPSHLRRNLKFLYGSNRWALTVNCAMALSFLRFEFVQPSVAIG